MKNGVIYHFWYFLNFYLFLGVPIFKGPEKYSRGVKKIGQRNFCVLWTLKGHKKQKLENEHENLAEGGFCDKTSYTICAPAWIELKNELSILTTDI